MARNEIVSCPYCGTKTFERMLKFHLTKCDKVTTGVPGEQPKDEPTREPPERITCRARSRKSVRRTISSFVTA